MSNKEIAKKGNPILEKFTKFNSILKDNIIKENQRASLKTDKKYTTTDLRIKNQSRPIESQNQSDVTKKNYDKSLDEDQKTKNYDFVCSSDQFIEFKTGQVKKSDDNSYVNKIDNYRNLIEDIRIKKGVEKEIGKKLLEIQLEKHGKKEKNHIEKQTSYIITNYNNTNDSLINFKEKKNQNKNTSQVLNNDFNQRINFINNLKPKQYTLTESFENSVESDVDISFESMDDKIRNIKLIQEINDFKNLEKPSRPNLTEREKFFSRKDENDYPAESFESYADEEIRFMHLDGYNRFYKSDYYHDQLFREKENKMKILNKDYLVFKSRLINNYFNPKTNISLPKLAMHSEKERKTKEILEICSKSIEDQAHYYYDDYPYLKYRNIYFKYATYISNYCSYVIKNPIFDNISLAIIFINTLIILISNPSDPNSPANSSDDIFLYIYTVEMILKIISFGFVLTEGAYIKDLWNILDFSIILVGWISFVIEKASNINKISGLSALRSFRVLRPLKTIKSIKGLRSLIVTIFKSILSLSDSALVLFFFTFIFAIAGVQMWSGQLKRRCMSLNYGYFYDFSNFTTICSFDQDCLQFSTPGNNFICAKSYINPNNDVTHFDNLGAALITVYVILTMEGWCDIWNHVNKAFKDLYGINIVIIILYFYVLLFVGGYYLINLFLAVIKTKFTSISVENSLKELPKKSLYKIVDEKFDLDLTKDKKIIKNRKIIFNEEQALKKLRSNTTFIKRNAHDIPIEYNTLNDILYLKTLEPVELNKLKRKILIEDEIIKKEFDIKKKDICLLIARSRQEELELETLNNNLNSQKETLNNKNLTNSDNDVFIYPIKKMSIDNSVVRTLEKLDYEVITKIKKLKLIRGDRSNTNPNPPSPKNRKKEDVKKKVKLNLTIKEDTSFELELKNQFKQQTNNINKNIAFTFSGKLDNNLFNNSTNEASNLTKYPYKLKKLGMKSISSSPKKGIYIDNIDEDISFLSDNSDEVIEDESKSQLEIKKFGYFYNNNVNETNLHNIPNFLSSIPKFSREIQNTILARKKAVLDEKYGIVTNVTFKRPSSSFSTKFNFKEKLELKKKFENNIKNFKIDDYIAQLKPNEVKSLPRGSYFLKSLVNLDEATNYNDIGISNKPSDNEPNFSDGKSLDISLIKEEDLIINGNSVSEIEMVNSKIPFDDKYLEENLELEEIKKDYSTRPHPQTKRMISDSKKINLKTISDLRGEEFNNKIDSEINNCFEIHNKQTKRFSSRHRTLEEDSHSNISKNYENILQNPQQDERKYYKARSVRKNYYKYPIIDLIEVKSNLSLKNGKSAAADSNYKKKSLPIHKHGKRRYLNYLYNIYDKDFLIRDKFKVDYWREDVLGNKPKEIEKVKKISETDPVFIFNDRTLNLKSYSYRRYKKLKLIEEEYVNHKLKNLGDKGKEIFPRKTKHYGMIKSNRHNIRHIPQKGFIIRSLAKTFSESKYLKLNRIPTNSPFNCSYFSKFITHHQKLKNFIKDKNTLNEKIQRKLNSFNYNTLSHYFLQDEILKKKLTPKNDLNNVSNGQLVAKDELEIKQQIEKIKIYDIQTNSHQYKFWSGQEVLNISDDPNRYEEWNKILGSLEEFEIILWKDGYFGIVQKIRYIFYYLSVNDKFDYFIIFIVIINAIVMSLDGDLTDPDTRNMIQISYFAFNAIYFAEFLIKFLGLGPITYFSDPLSYLDVFIITFATVDMIIIDEVQTLGRDSNIASQFAFLRVFRIFKVITLTKLIRRMKTIRKILTGITKSLANVAYIILILVIFLFIFQLLGMSLLNAYPPYQKFLSSFYITFQILTVENWNGILYDLALIHRATVLYLVLWIFIGNYILFNLFISVLLDSFDGISDDEDKEEYDENKEKFRNILPKFFQQYELADKDYQHRLNKKLENDEVEKIEEINLIKIYALPLIGNPDISHNNNYVEDYDIYNDLTVNGHEELRHCSYAEKMVYEWEKREILFENVDCEFSLFLLPQTNRFRIFMMKLALNKKFDNLIIFIILFSYLRLILDTFITGYLSDTIFDILDLAFTTIFVFEAMVKIVSLGFVLNHGAYLHDNWNKIDFIIVVVSIIDFIEIIGKIFGSVPHRSLGFLKVLKLLRLLRPLRFISHNVHLKLIITSLFDSVVPILNMLFVILIVFFMASIIGMNIFYDYYDTCYSPGDPGFFKPLDSKFQEELLKRNLTKKDMIEYHKVCEEMGGIMFAAPKFKFSNLFTSLLTCYVLSNMEGWPDLMNSNKSFNEITGLFFIAYLIIVSYFFLNLFVGIMFNCFHKAWTKEKNNAILDNHAAERYWDWLKQIEYADPDYETYKVPTKGYRFYFHKFASSKYFDNFILAIIILNMILMSMTFDDIDDTVDNIFDNINLTFSSIFICECIIKLTAFGLKGYFFHGWNQFDFFVAFASSLDIIVLYTTSSRSSFLRSFQIIRVLRVLRITSILRIAKSLKGLEKLLQTLRWSITALTNIFILLFLLFSIFAIAGCLIYDVIKYEKYKDKFVQINEFFNFDDFYKSFMLVFRCATGENWPDIMMELMNGI